MSQRNPLRTLLLAAAAGLIGPGSASAADAVRMGAAAFDDWHGDRPGVTRHITPADLPAPFASASASHGSAVADAPADAIPQAPAGFTVTRFADGLTGPRVLRVAPNGDIFVAETGNGVVRVLRAPDGAGTVASQEVFAKGLDGPFGIAFYPPGPDPQWVYLAQHNSVLRIAYRSGQMTAAARPQVVVAKLSPTERGHSTRDIAFSLDGKKLYVSVGSASNVAEGLRRMPIPQAQQWEEAHGLGAAWDGEANRADVLEFDPDGTHGRVYATGLRNCAGLGVHPTRGDVWCVVNERDGLGDDLPPDYATRVRSGAFYGWPWYYIGHHEDPRLQGARPDLAGKVTAPDVLFQAHSAPLGIVFYQPPAGAVSAFPPAYRGTAFVALHGSWNRAKRTGYKLVRLPMTDGVPSGAYEDFLTGFVLDEDNVWGRPVGVAVAHDGALLVSEDGNGTIWRVSYERR
jgi:glucose/arabinose dehydrogenase